jgi:5-methylcytosine-specific restriction endonuclease McrA
MPMDKTRYPANWNEIATTVKAEAGWACECCSKPCRKPGEKVYALLCRLDDEWIAKLVDGDDEDIEIRPQRFALTVAHLDQDPGNNQRDNLRALCTPCHLAHDAHYLTYNRMRKRERQGQMTLEGVAG